jgi:hypothetical protein
MTNKDYIDEYMHYATLSDAYELIGAIGLYDFLSNLYTEKSGRLLTIDEKEAMQVLHDRWEL